MVLTMCVGVCAGGDGREKIELDREKLGEGVESQLFSGSRVH